MTDKDKRDARARMRVTGENYTTALRWVRQARIAPSPLPPSCREQRDVPADELGERGEVRVEMVSGAVVFARRATVADPAPLACGVDYVVTAGGATIGSVMLHRLRGREPRHEAHDSAGRYLGEWADIYDAVTRVWNEWNAREVQVQADPVLRT